MDNLKIQLNKEYCGLKGSEDVLNFIENFLGHNNDLSSESYLKQQFAAGYCYYFAVILKTAFNRGKICWCAPYGHICWVDDDGTPYDVYGICTSEAEYFIPVSFLGDCLNDFLHTGKPHNTSEEEISNIIKSYIESNN